MTGSDLSRLADGLRRLPPSCGPVRLIGVDGHAGSGKTTFAARLAAVLDGAPVLHLDDLASHAELFGWTRRLREQVLEPLSHGRTAYYRPYDWHTRRFTAPLTLPAGPLAVVEGVGAGRRALRPWLAELLWMDMAAEPSWLRGRRRDGAELTAFWDTWVCAERAHFAADPSRFHAGFLVRQSSASPGGYTISPGPAVGARPDPSITHRDRPGAGRDQP